MDIMNTGEVKRSTLLKDLYGSNSGYMYMDIDDSIGNYTLLDDESIYQLAEMIKDVKPNYKIYINFIGPIIGSHSGQGKVALFFKGKMKE